jgi:hypothetical protein
MFSIKPTALKWLYLLVLLAAIPAGVSASDAPWKAAEPSDLEGIWRQVGVVVLDSETDSNDPWFQAKQFFRFPEEGGYRHVLANPDSQPGRLTPTEMQLFMLQQGPAVQTLKWHSRGIGLLKHPERPQQRVDFGLYLRDMPTGPLNGAVKPKQGDLVVMFYAYKDANLPWYYRILRKLP